MPRVAVVVPCYNDGATLPETLESLRSQEPHELVVVDDGSTGEATLRVLADLERDGVRMIHQRNSGLSDARMAGVAATSAPYVLPLDADDTLAPGAVAALADALDDDSGAAMAWGDVEIWGEIELPVQIGRHLDRWLISYLNTLPVASLVRREALLEVGGWQLRHGYEDWDLWMSFAEKGWTGVYTPHPTLRYRRREGRMLGDCVPRHNELVAELRSRHPDLLASRRAAWVRSRAPLRTRLVFPLVEALPLSDFEKSRWFQFANQPAQVLRLRRLRRRSAHLRDVSVAR
jgi:glycosyltransferase involved in cell wall biosynthesis